MFKIHVLATDRGEGKTRWLQQSANKIMYSQMYLESPENVLFIVPVLKYMEPELKDMKRNYPKLLTCNFDNIDQVFRGHHIDSVFVDEYQKLTPRQWDLLKQNLALSRVQELYLAGDNYFTLDQLSRDPNDTEHLYRRLAYAHEITRRQ